MFSQTEHAGKFSTVPFTFAFLPLDKFLAPDAKKSFKEEISRMTAEDPILKKMVEQQLAWSDKLSFLE